MARFVLVHGASAGAWTWRPLATELRAAGHTVEAFDLPEAPARPRRMSRERGCTKVVELETDHTPQLAMCTELAAAMDQFAGQAAAL